MKMNVIMSKQQYLNSLTIGLIQIQLTVQIHFFVIISMNILRMLIISICQNYLKKILKQ